MDTRERVERMIERLKSHMSEDELDKIRRAYECAEKAHTGQKRKNGEPYIIHPVSVAEIIAELGMDCDAICAGLLHDCIEDTDMDYDAVKAEFGETVAELVDGVTRLGQLQYSKEQEQMEDLRKMFLAMTKDIRVIIIKLADRLHNMRTIQFMTEEKQRAKSVETMEIFTPLAHRLGMQRIKWELEDLSMRCLDPVSYQEITAKLEQDRQRNDAFLENIRQAIADKLTESGIRNTISARVKHVYSIYRKMHQQLKTIDEIFDIYAVRVIVDSVADCYNVLGYIHDLYRPIPGRFKDYISTPKPNGYQSLHTTVIGRAGLPFEVQIRTEEMHKMAEYGVAAHWKYKLGIQKNGDEEAYAWVSSLLEAQQDTEAEDFIHSLKVDMFSDEVFVFTPQGEVKSFPVGATPIDFAYRIHSGVGNSMVGCKIGGKIANISRPLQNGDQVEIITSKEAKGPKREWLRIVKTSEARSKIKQWFKKECREENIVQGKSDLERELHATALYRPFSESEDIQNSVLVKFGYNTMEELYASIGYGGITVTKVINKVKDEVIRARKAAAAAAAAEKPEEKREDRSKSTPYGVIVEGIENCQVRFSRCCTPIPGDDIVGYVTKGYGVSVHRRDCKNYLHSVKTNADRWINVSWERGDIDANQRFNTMLQITTDDRIGVMNAVLTVLTKNRISVKDFDGKTLSENFAYINVVIAVTGLPQLEALINKLRGIRGVLDVERNAVSEGRR